MIIFFKKTTPTMILNFQITPIIFFLNSPISILSLNVIVICLRSLLSKIVGTADVFKAAGLCPNSHQERSRQHLSKHKSFGVVGAPSKSLSLQLQPFGALISCVSNQLPGMSSVPITKINGNYIVHNYLYFKQSQIQNRMQTPVEKTCIV